MLTVVLDGWNVGALFVGNKVGVVDGFSQRKKKKALGKYMLECFGKEFLTVQKHLKIEKQNISE